MSSISLKQGIQVFDQNKTTSFLVVDTALKYALSQNVDCINMSLGFNQEYMNQYNFLDHSLYELYLNNIIFISLINSPCQTDVT